MFSSSYELHLKYIFLDPLLLLLFALISFQLKDIFLLKSNQGFVNQGTKNGYKYITILRKTNVGFEYVEEGLLNCFTSKILLRKLFNTSVSLFA